MLFKATYITRLPLQQSIILGHSWRRRVVLTCCWRNSYVASISSVICCSTMVGGIKRTYRTNHTLWQGPNSYDISKSTLKSSLSNSWVDNSVSCVNEPGGIFLCRRFGSFRFRLRYLCWPFRIVFKAVSINPQDFLS